MGLWNRFYRCIENRTGRNGFERVTFRMDVERLTGTEWRRLRRIRLAALEDAPDAFGTTVEAARELPDGAMSGWVSGRQAKPAGIRPHART